MNISKVFGFILALHAGVLLVLFVQPGCYTTVGPPTQSDYELKKIEDEALSSPSDLDSIYAQSDSEGSELTQAELDQFNQVPGIETEGADSFSVRISGDNLDTYIIQSGDTLWELSKQFDTTINELCELNGISKDAILKIGSVLKVPMVDGKIVKITKETASDYQPSTYEGSGQSYTVVSGDTLSKIAYMYRTNVAAIKATNNLDTHIIQIGKVLLIPVEGSIQVKDAVATEIVPADTAAPIQPEPSEPRSDSTLVQEAEPLATSASKPVEDIASIEDLQALEGYNQVEVITVPSND